MKFIFRKGWLILLMFSATPGFGAVVLNEIFYHAPNDWDQLQWIELHNTSHQHVDLTGWSLAKGVKLKFPSGARIEGDGYLVVSHEAALFKQFYQQAPAFLFERILHHKGDKLELKNRAGEVVDSVKFTHETPWPLTAAGLSSSLERICPDSPGDDPYNWTASPPAANYDQPRGTPGAKNSSYSPTRPPVIESVALASEVVAPGSELEVTAKVAAPDQIARLQLRYRVSEPGKESEEKSVPMAVKSVGVYTGKVPAQEQGRIIRVRVVAEGQDGSHRSLPSENDLRPAQSAWVRQALPPSKLTQFVVIQSSHSNAQRERSNGPSPEDQQRWALKSLYRSRLNLVDLWASLAFTNQLTTGQFDSVSKVFATAFERRNASIRALDESEDVPPKSKLNQEIDWLRTNLVSALAPTLTPEQNQLVAEWLKGSTSRREVFDVGQMLKNWVNIEESFFRAGVFGGGKADTFATLRETYREFLPRREALRSAVPADFGNNESREKFQTKVEQLQREISGKTHPFLGERKEGTRPPDDEANFFRPRPPKSTSPATRERTALIVIEPDAPRPVLYDFVRLTTRNAGWKIHFPKTERYREMSAVNVIFEYNDRFVLAEPLAFELYRRAGNGASLTDFVRLTLDGEMQGYHLLCEQPNKEFLRRLGLRDDGNMYKQDYKGNDLESLNEKKTHIHEGYDDLKEIVRQLEETQGEAQWKIIRQKFDIPQVATYFAVSTLLGHWDGYANNYFAYHDQHSTGKWRIFPWDLDKTMGFHDRLPPGEVFTTMPLTFGMKGDLPANWDRAYPPTSFRDVLNLAGWEWWRPPGVISGPLLANPKFRAYYLARVKELLGSEFTESKMNGAIDRLAPVLRPEVELRATARGEDPKSAVVQFDHNLDSLRRFVVGRRAFLLNQLELQAAAPKDEKDL